MTTIMVPITEEKYFSDLNKLLTRIKSWKRLIESVHGIPRGGTPIATYIAGGLGIPLVPIEDINSRTLIVDDLIDSGATLKKLREKLIPHNPAVAVLYRKPHSPKVDYAVEEINGWIDFFYEEPHTDTQEHIRRILEFIGENPNREGLQDTPKRHLNFLQEFTNPPEFNFTTFDGEEYDEMIIQREIPFFSLCEHHIVPFFGFATVAYIPQKRIVGLSKLTRTVEWYARRLQNQERITSQVAQRLTDELEPLGVGVSLRARHLCMEMRGVRTHDVFTITNKLTGVFKALPEVRAEFLRQL